MYLFSIFKKKSSWNLIQSEYEHTQYKQISSLTLYMYSIYLHLDPLHFAWTYHGSEYQLLLYTEFP